MEEKIVYYMHCLGCKNAPCEHLSNGDMKNVEDIGNSCPYENENMVQKSNNMLYQN